MPKPAEALELEVLSDDLSSLLHRADDHPLVLERDGKRYTLSRAEIGAYYDPEALRAVLYEFAGFLSDDEANEMKEYLRRGREEGSRTDREPTIPGGHRLDH